MFKLQDKIDHPIRVVMFGSGPELTPDAKKFLYILDSHPEIELLGAFCQSQSTSFSAVIKDLWKRRGILVIPLLFAKIITDLLRFLKHPGQEYNLKRNLKNLSPRIHFFKNIHSQEVLDQVRLLDPDLGLIYGSPILKPILFEIPRLGTLGIHHGKVPDYKGNKTTFWAMYNNENTAGVTIQKINKGLDTGSIVKEGEVVIGRKSYQTVWQELEKLGLDLYIQAILEVKYGTATYRQQPSIKTKLYKNPKIRDFLILWFKQIKKRFS